MIALHSWQHGTSRGHSDITSVRCRRERLTVLIPCKNESQNIRPCIESIRSLADEILVADSGSTDDTLKIVREMGGCRIIGREYVNSADFKNWAIPQAAHPWVFIVDADERIPRALADEITKVLRDPAPGIDAYSCAFQDFFMGYPLKYAGWDTESIRLIRRDVCRYQKRRVHANIDIDRRRVRTLRTKILHYSIWAYEDFVQKYNRYTSWASQELWEKGKRASFYSLLIRPVLRFLNMYLLRGGFLDGLPGLQICILMSFFSTYLKQGKLWQMESALWQSDLERRLEEPQILKYPTQEALSPTPAFVSSPDADREPRRHVA
jgi:glycosyltransferase involved in cell wall biosynthesis